MSVRFDQRLATNRYPCRPLIKAYIEAGYSYLFSSQVISFSTVYRKSAYQKIAAAIDEVVDRMNKAAGDTTATVVETAKTTQKQIHNSEPVLKTYSDDKPNQTICTGGFRAGDEQPNAKPQIIFTMR